MVRNVGPICPMGKRDRSYSPKVITPVRRSQCPIPHYQFPPHKTMTEETIWIVTEAEPEEETQEASGAKGARSTNPFDRTKEKVVQAIRGTRVSAVSADKLEAKMSEFLRVVGRVFKNAEKEANLSSGFCLDEIQLSLEVNGEGEVKLIGTGGKAGAKGAITLKFKRETR